MRHLTSHLFLHQHLQVTDLTGARAAWMEWASCFELVSPSSTKGPVGKSARPVPALADPQAEQLARSVRQLRMRGLRALYRVVPTGIDITERWRHSLGSTTMTGTLTGRATTGAMVPVPLPGGLAGGGNADSVTLHLEPVAATVHNAPGEFMMLYAFGVGEGGDLDQRYRRRRPSPTHPIGRRGQRRCRRRTG